MSVPADTYVAVLTALDAIGQGKTETEACDNAKVSVATFRATVQKQPELFSMFIDAEARGYDNMADRLARIDEWGIAEGVTDVRMLTLLSKNIQWLLSKRKPHAYGERSVVEHNITADRAVIEAISAGKQRALGGKLLEDITYTVVEELTRPALPGPAVIELDPEYAEFAG